MPLREGASSAWPEGYLPADINGQEVTGFNESWVAWLGILHTLFAREHNVLCGELHAPIGGGATSGYTRPRG